MTASTRSPLPPAPTPARRDATSAVVDVADGPDAASGPIAGAATVAGTTRYAARFAARFLDDFYRPLGRAGDAAALRVGSIGLGTYLGECTPEDDARYDATLRAGLAAGCNLVDTASNYRCQRSERAVGRALAGAIADGTVRRDEVVVCSKGGYVALDGAPPPTRDAYDAFLEREFFAPGVMTPADLAHGGHAMAPGFLAHQIARSRANLGVTTIDIYYLHEPERQLDRLAPAAFAVALRAAVEALEASVARGEIARWGVASWRGLRVPPGTRGHLALADVVAAARDVAGDAHHLATVQLPINLAMPEAVRTPTQPLPTPAAPERVVSVLQAAQELAVPLVASAALMHGQLAANLPPALREAFNGCDSDAQRAVSFVRDLPGVRSTLMGVRSTAHLNENLRVAR